MNNRFAPVFLFLAVISSFETGTKLKAEEYVPCEAASLETSTTNGGHLLGLGSTCEMPDEKVFGERLGRALCTVDDEVARIRKMVRQGLAKKEYWNGSFTGTVVIPGEKSVYHFVFDENGEKVGQVNKMVFEDEPYGKKIKAECCTLVFYDDVDRICSFSCGESPEKVTLNFYRNLSLESCGIACEGMYYRAKWSNDGKLILQSRRKLDN